MRTPGERLRDRLNRTHAGVLEPGERYVAAAPVHLRRPPPPPSYRELAVRAVESEPIEQPPGLTLTTDMIWAATDRRLLIWKAGRVTGATPTDQLASLSLGAEVNAAAVNARARGTGPTSRSLTVAIRATLVTVEGFVEDALPRRGTRGSDCELTG